MQPRRQRSGALGPLARNQLANAERLFRTSPREAAVEAAPLLEGDGPPNVRAHAMALVAIARVATGSRAGTVEADQLLAEATRLAPRSRAARGRIAHARGYLAYKRGEHSVAIERLNEAASLFKAMAAERGQVFDTLGMYFTERGDLERARQYYTRAIKLKKSGRGLSARESLAITYGNLGRLELGTEEYAAAEHWFEKDLECIGEKAPAGVVAHLKNQLALALIGQGESRFDDAEEQLTEALTLAAKGSVTEAYLLKDLARIAFLKGDFKKASQFHRKGGALAREQGYQTVQYALDLVGARIATARARKPGDDEWLRAAKGLDAAHAGFASLEMHREVCDVAVARAELLGRFGQASEALRVLTEVALETAERHFFHQPQPLARIEARIAELDGLVLSRYRARRMLGGLSPEQHSAHLRGARQRLTVWTCDIRGFTSYCAETGDPLLVVHMLNRFFETLGRLILDCGGRIDKYVGDNILAYFRKPSRAAGAALAAMDAVALLNREREHLEEPVLDIGVGIATGEVVEGNVGFAGKLEHTIIGTAVNTACRLVGEAEPRQVLVDSATRDALTRQFKFRSQGVLDLKGLGSTRVYELRGR